MSTRHDIHEAADRARYTPDRSGWEDVLSSGLESLGAVLLDGGVPVRVSVGYSDQPATRDEVRSLERQFAADWPDYALGPWQAGDGAECVATVRRR